jgi:hypothetical protein
MGSSSNMRPSIKKIKNRLRMYKKPLSLSTENKHTHKLKYTEEVDTNEINIIYDEVKSFSKYKKYRLGHSIEC